MGQVTTQKRGAGFHDARIQHALLFYRPYSQESTIAMKGLTEKELTGETIVEDARAIFQAAVQGVQADVLLNEVDWSTLTSRQLSAYENVRVIGLGKASMAMASVVEEVLGGRILDGCVVVPKGYGSTLPYPFKMPRRIQVIEGGHPVPDASSEAAAHVLLEIAEKCGENDLVITLVSGGGSALTSSFAGDISLEDGQEVVKQLLRCGADIHEMNTVRKHISIFGGGRLAQKAMPAELVALVISDVVGDDLSVIASGPTVGDPSTFAEAIRVLRRYDIWESMPASVKQHLTQGAEDLESETPGPEDPVFARVKTKLIGTNQDALKAACREAARRQYTVCIHDQWIEGEARDAGQKVADVLLKQNESQPACHLWGGETTVTVKGKGLGGRNQELALGGAFLLEGQQEKVVLLSGGTDGIDGPTDAAGAIATPDTLTHARQRKRNPEAYLAENDAYTFFLEMDALLMPGPTHTNVMDVVIGLVRA